MSPPYCLCAAVSLDQAGVEPHSAGGFEEMASNHLRADQAVVRGKLMIRLLCRHLWGLLRDFLSCLTERLDFAVPNKYLNLLALQSLLEILGSSSFVEEP